MALAMGDIRINPVSEKTPKSCHAVSPNNIKSRADYQLAEFTIPRLRNDVKKLMISQEKIIASLREPEKKINISPPTQSKSWQAKNYLWVLEVFLVILIIGSRPEEDFSYDPEIGPDSETPLVINLPEEERMSPQSGHEIYKIQPEEICDEPALEVFNYSGKWGLCENEIRSGYYLICVSVLLHVSKFIADLI
jgi:hypothetical protein